MVQNGVSFIEKYSNGQKMARMPIFWPYLSHFGTNWADWAVIFYGESGDCYLSIAGEKPKL